MLTLWLVSNILNNQCFFFARASSGGAIDLFTQKIPDGRGINQSSGVFQPQEEVVLYALVTYDGVPVQSKTVSFEVIPPNPIPGFPLIRISFTNAGGIATIIFLLPGVPLEEILGTWFALAAVDIAEERVVDSLTFQVCMIEQVISATISIHPQTLDLRSKGKWITAYIEFPKGYDVNDINVSSIMLNGTIPSELKPKAIGDYDNDGILDLMIKFNRTEVIDYILDSIDIEKRFTTVTLTITGYLYDGTPFQGSDTIKIVMSHTHMRR